MRRILSGTVSLGLFAVGAAHAFGLAEISQQSALGEPLRLVIPIVADAIESEDLAGECFRVVPAMGNDMPQPRARLTLERTGLQSFVILSTAYPIDEPIMRVAVQAGCGNSISREYTVLLDPIGIYAPVVRVAAPAERTLERAVDAPTPASSLAQRGTAVSERRPQQVSRAARNRSGSAPRIGATTEYAGEATAAAATTPHRGVKASTAPRLRISSAIGGGAGGPAAATPHIADREALMAIEEQTVVLERQIAELTRQMGLIEQQLREARSARGATERTLGISAAVQTAAAERAQSTTSWWTLLRTWGADDWPWILLAPLLAALLATRLAQRRGQRVLVPPPFTATQAEAFNRADLGEPSVPGATSSRDREVLVASMHDRPRGHMIPPLFVDPIEPEKPSQPGPRQYEYDPGIDFDEEVRKAYEQASEYSILEREEPAIVARVVEGWGTARSTAQLDNCLLAPHRNGKPLSYGAMEELKLLRSIAMEQVTDLNSFTHSRVGNLRTRAGAIAGTH